MWQWDPETALAGPEPKQWDCSAEPLPPEQDGRCCRRVTVDVCSADLRQFDRPAKVSESWTTVPFLIHLRSLRFTDPVFSYPRKDSIFLEIVVL